MAIFSFEIEGFRKEKGPTIMLYIRFQTVKTGKRQTKYGR